MSKNFIPSTTEQTIGTTTKRWRSIYVNKINTNDSFINDVLVTFSSTVPDVEVAPAQYGFTIQNGRIVSFILAKYPRDKTLLLRVQSHSTDNTVVDYRDIPYSDFVPNPKGLALTNYDLTGMNIPIISGNYASISFLYITPTGIKGKQLDVLANMPNTGGN